MTSVPGSSARSRPSSVVIRSPSAEARTRIAPFTLSASNACVGWFSRKSTKFEASTTELIERCPIAAIFSLSHTGDSDTETPETSTIT